MNPVFMVAVVSDQATYCVVVPDCKDQQDACNQAAELIYNMGHDVLDLVAYKYTKPVVAYIYSTIDT